LQNGKSILNKLTLQKIAKFVTKKGILDKKVKTQQQQNKKIKHKKTLVGDENWTQDLSHTKQMRYLCTMKSTESIDCSQAM